MDKYNLKERIVCVIDFGGHNEIAIELAKSFGTVYYYTEWRDPFPTYQKKIIGTGIPNVIRIYDLEPIEDTVDLWYFCDLFYGHKADKLRKSGKTVFGAGLGENLELDRKGFKDLMVNLGMPVNKNKEVIGITNLREYLKENFDVYVKLNADMRGHLESAHCENYDLYKPVLDALQHQLGLDCESAEFLVETPIRPAIEYGYDGSFNGNDYPKNAMFGVEIKDAAYGCVVVDYDKLPKKVKEYNEKLKPILQGYDYRGAIGNEIRHKEKGEAYLIDIYCRQPQPPTSLQIRMIEDYGVFAYETALGRNVDIKFKSKYGVMIVICSDWAKTEPQAIYFDEKYRDNISIKNLAIRDGIYYYIPTIGCEMQEIGAVCGQGNTLKEAKNKCIEAAKSIKGYGIKINCDALEEAQEEIDKLKNYGINLF
jgi:hypothetical protein